VSDDADSLERLREIVFEQQQALQHERAQRLRAEAMLEGLERLLTIDDVQASFERLVQVARPLLDFEHALLLLPDPGGDDLVATMATHPAWRGARWPHGRFVDRVLAGEPSASFDVAFVPEWKGVLDGSRPPVCSALHVAIRGLGTRALFVCVHPARAHFSTEHLARARLLAPLASQILINVEHQRARVAEERLHEHAKALAAARDEAQQASRAKSAFLASVSHELRTPLNAIIGYGELISEELEDDDALGLGDDVHRILSAARHLLGLIGDVLDLSRIEAGRVTIVPTDVELAPFVDELSQMVEPLVAHNHNELVVQWGEGVPATVRFDSGKVRQVLLNLLSNAAKFTERGRVALNIERQGDELCFEVADTGCGIGPEHLGRLFEVFERVDHGLGQVEGTGLGLAVSRQLARTMGGEVQVRSELGVGSTFTARLPLT
jgi:signal transduction histidine kinase